MTRVALLPSAYLPTLGGVQELTRNLALALTAAGDDVEIWTQQDDETPRPSTRSMDGLVVRRFPFPLPRADIRALPSLTARAIPTLMALRRAVQDFAPDILHVQCFGPNGVYATAVSRMCGLPLVVTLQGETVMDDHDAFAVSTTLRTALRWSLRRAAAVTGCSQFTLDDAIARFGLDPAAGRVVFNGVDLDNQPVGPTGRERYVLATGRVVDKKGFDLLLKAWPMVARRHPAVALAIAGSGPAEPALRALAADLGIADGVRFLGRLSREEVATTMAGADVFVMPSRLEPFGIVVLEAWRAGRAVVATRHGGPPEFVREGETGLLADPFDQVELAGQINLLLDEAELRRRVGEAARQEVGRFSWPVIAEQYRSIYRRVLSTSGSPSGRGDPAEQLG